MTVGTEIVGAKRLDHGATHGALAIEGGAIVSRAPAGARRFDARGLLALPGIVDVHGDAFERQLMPRPKVSFPADVALLETDRQLVANGITTAYHGLTVSWEPGLRSLDSAERFIEHWQALRGQLLCDTRLHLRWETFALEAATCVSQWLALEPTPILAFNDHTTLTMESSLQAAKGERMAERTGMKAQDYRALLHSAWARREEVPAAVTALAARARERGAVLLAHDERSPAERSMYRELGARASEFPMNELTARAARDAGEHTVFGAPNVVRGGSHNNALNASDAIRHGLCTVLASDYYYPAPLLAPFVLERNGTLPLAQAWKLVSTHPAEVAGLHDRGTLAPGMRADLLLVDTTLPARPSVVATFVNGECVYQRGESRWLAA